MVEIEKNLTTTTHSPAPSSAPIRALTKLPSSMLSYILKEKRSEISSFLFYFLFRGERWNFYPHFISSFAWNPPSPFLPYSFWIPWTYCKNLCLLSLNDTLPVGWIPFSCQARLFHRMIPQNLSPMHGHTLRELFTRGVIWSESLPIVRYSSWLRNLQSGLEPYSFCSVPYHCAHSNHFLFIFCLNFFDKPA